MHQLLLATRNRHKTREFAEILGDGVEVRDLTDVAELPAAEEIGLTFEANAILKAVETSKHFEELMVVADDSGLEVDALRGAPGIYSARYAGEHATDAANMAKLLAELTPMRTCSLCSAFSLFAGVGERGGGPPDLSGCRRGDHRRRDSRVSGFWLRSCLPAARVCTDLR